MKRQRRKGNETMVVRVPEILEHIYRIVGLQTKGGVSYLVGWALVKALPDVLKRFNLGLWNDCRYSPWTVESINVPHLLGEIQYSWEEEQAFSGFQRPTTDGEHRRLTTGWHTWDAEKKTWDMMPDEDKRMYGYMDEAGNEIE